MNPNQKKLNFKNPLNELEGYPEEHRDKTAGIPDELCIHCPKCKSTVFRADVERLFDVCPECGYYFHMSPRQRIDFISDKDSFDEINTGLKSRNILNFPGYEEKLEKAHRSSGEADAVVTGFASIGGFPFGLFVMDGAFMMGSMGTVVGDKLTFLFEEAAEKNLPVIGYTVSGGARMQEGILSLMQMAKVSAAVKRHSDAGNLYISFITDPTTGGVTASFAMLGDMILAEPNALVGFAGQRVIEQTIRQKLPKNFQRAEFVEQCGFIDKIVPRSEQRAFLAAMLHLHEKRRKSDERL